MLLKPITILFVTCLGLSLVCQSKSFPSGKSHRKYTLLICTCFFVYFKQEFCRAKAKNQVRANWFFNFSKSSVDQKGDSVFTLSYHQNTTQRPKDWRLKKLTILILIFLLIKCLIFNQIFSGILPLYIFVENL